MDGKLTIPVSLVKQSLQECGIWTGKLVRKDCNK